ncbi:MAG: N-6 DNA methylase [Bacteroidales bacterium]|nr:N-6 DNA methylase [Bacteroidales bacterium]
MGWNEVEISKKKIEVATRNFRGIDKDYFLSKIANAYMNLVGDGTTGIFCEDSLESPKNWRSEAKSKIELGTFDILLTNPPFGSTIKVEGEEKLKQFDLAHQWKRKKSDNEFEKNNIKDKEVPQILFIERCLQLLKDGGKMAIVLPDGILNNAKIIAIIDVSLETFLPHTGTKTSILVLQKIDKEKLPKNYPIFLSIAEYCGHDRRGKEIEKDDIPEVAKYFNEWITNNKMLSNGCKNSTCKFRRHSERTISAF